MHSLVRLHFLAPGECERALALLDQTSLAPARADGGFKGRLGTVGWLERSGDSEWIYERMRGYGLEYASRHGIDATGLEEPLQYVEYPRGTRFDWHIDTGTRDTADRKITISVQLSRPADYEGGTLELVGEHPVLQSRTQGAGIAFSSALAHRVTRIKRGKRRALVGWILGPPYR